MKKMQKHTSMTSFFPCTSKGNNMIHSDGTKFTIYTEIQLPNGKHKTVTLHTEYNLKDPQEAQDLLKAFRILNDGIGIRGQMMSFFDIR